MNLLKKRLLKIAVGLVVLLGIYAVAGFWLLPLWLKSFVPEKIQQLTGRTAGVERIAINPFALTVRVDGLTLYAADGRTPAMQVGELYADVSSTSLIHRALVIDEIRIRQPRLSFARLTPERFSYSDIVDRLQSAPKAPEPSKPLNFALYNIQLTDGQVDFDDHVSGRQHHIEQLQFSLPFISDLAHKVQIFVQPQLSARINGSLIEVKGRSQPFAADRATSLDLDFDAFDIPTYLGLVPVKLDYVPTAGKLDSKLTLTFRQPSSASPQVTLQGQLKISGLEIRQRVSGASMGVASLDVDLRRSQLLKMRLDIAQAGIGGLHVNLQGKDKPAVTVDKIVLNDAAYDEGAHTLHAASLSVATPSLALRRGKGGRIDLLNALLPPAPRGSAHKPAASQAPEKSGPPLSAMLDKFSVTDGHVLFDDTSADRPVHLDLQAMKFSAEELTTAAGARIPLTFSADLGKGHIAITGGVIADPLKLDLDTEISSLDLSPLQGYFSSRLNVDIRRMNLGTHGHLDFARGNSGAMQVHYSGKLDVTHLALRDRLNGQPFLNWKSLDIAKLDVQYPARGAPFQLLLGSVALTDFYARVIVNADARLNLQDVVVSSENAQAAGQSHVSVTAPTSAPADATPKSVKAVPAAGPSPRIRLGPITLSKGRVSYTDNYIKPNYSAHLTDLTGSIGRVASDRPAPATVALKGRLDGDGTLALKGAVNPLARPLYLDLTADARDIELTRLTPYAAKYAGYAIDKGKLSVDVSYHIENENLQAQNHVYLDQLTFGKRIDSPDATKLPVLLAVALLKDRNGVIDVNLPVSGSLSDPQFSIGGVILRVLTNLLAKAVTSPFALLGSAFGGGDELGYVEFAPGSAELSAADTGKLDKLAKALNDRPALKLDVSGRVDPAVDTDGLKHEALMQLVRREKIRELGDGGKNDGANRITVSEAEYSKYLKKAYDHAKFSKPRNFIGLAKDLPTAEMEKLILANTPVDENSLHDLAMQRATTVRNYLADKGKVPSEHLFLAAPHLDADGIHDKGMPTRVDFQIK